jgi:hypothetical protein
MARCDYCGSLILFSGKKDANGRFCNARCQNSGALMAISHQLPDSSVREQLLRWHQGPCPVCKGPGPVDVYSSYEVWSAVVITRYSTHPILACRRCALKHQAKSMGLCLVAGWWGIPFGLIITPIQVGRNIYAMLRPPDPMKPSEKLEKTVRMTLAGDAFRRQRGQQAANAGLTTPAPL